MMRDERWRRIKTPVISQPQDNSFVLMLILIRGRLCMHTFSSSRAEELCLVSWWLLDSYDIVYGLHNK